MKALVTGATKGLGRAIVLELARRNVEVYATGRNAELLEQVKERTG